MKKISDHSLPPHRFTWELYCGKIGCATTQILRLNASYQTTGFKEGVKLLGITDASSNPGAAHADENTLTGLGFRIE